MPKKPRQAHIPQQSKRRRARRAGTPVNGPVPISAARTARAPADAETLAPPAATAPAPQARTGRRLQSLRAPQLVTDAYRAVPGQLPTFERAYLMRELRQISITAGGLLMLIIVLAILIR